LERKKRGRIQGLLKFFWAAIYRAHRAVIFAVAELSFLPMQSINLSAAIVAALVNVDIFDCHPHWLECSVEVRQHAWAYSL